jgi:hypothetical protein
MMRRPSFVHAVILLAVVFCFGPPAHASSNQLYLEANLIDPATHLPFPAGTYNATFEIYKATSGGTAMWSESKPVTVARGMIKTTLGSVTPIPLAVLQPDRPTSPITDRIFTSESRWLQIKFADKETPTVFTRMKINTAAYAANADRLDGLDAGQFALLHHTHSASDITSGSISGTGTVVLKVTNTGPNGAGIYGWSQNGSGVEGVTSAAGKAAVDGSSAGGNGIGVHGYGYQEYGVIGETWSGIGMMGRNNQSGNWVDNARGDMAIKAYASGTATGGGHGIEVSSVKGDGLRSFTSGASKSGVYAVVSGDDGYGAYLLSSAVNGTGIFAQGGTSGWAATFRGNVRILDRATGAGVMELGKGLDYAEGFDVTARASVAPGSVVVIDPQNPGKLTLSEVAYDSKVAGIVAGANSLGSGVRLGAGQFDFDVALAGRVYCNVDAAQAEIRPGDLLTTSTTPGHAMRATDHNLAQGAILGKAMQGLGKGEKGQILVLVTLQ